MKNLVKRMLSRVDDEGRCQRCKFSWNHCDPKYVSFGETDFATPLCEKCLYEIHPLIATRYFKKMWVHCWEKPVDDDARKAFRVFQKSVHDLQMEKNNELGKLKTHEARRWMYY